MNKMVKSFTDDPSFVLLKDEGNYYIFKESPTPPTNWCSIFGGNVWGKTP